MSCWSETPIHVVDFEGHRAYGVVEYGVVTIRKREIVRCQTRICRATGNIPREDTRLHGLTRRSTLEQTSFGEEWPNFVELRRTGLLSAHNAGFEHVLLKSIWAYPPFSPDFLHPGQEIADWGPWLDTCKLARTVWPEAAQHRLEFLIRQSGLQDLLEAEAERWCPPARRHYHAALYDALAAALLLLYILRQPDQQALSLPALLQLAGRLGPEQQEQASLFDEIAYGR